MIVVVVSAVVVVMLLVVCAGLLVAIPPGDLHATQRKQRAMAKSGNEMARLLDRAQFDPMYVSSEEWRDRAANAAAAWYEIEK